MPWLLQPVFKKIYHRLLYKTSWPLIISDTHQAVKNIHKSPTKVIPNGVNLRQFDIKVSKTSTKTIVFLGRFHHQKGIDILLPAFKQVLTKHPQANLVLIGSGTELASIKTTIKNLNLSKKVSLPGQITGKKLIKILKQAKIFVLPSRFEGQAISLLLAMAAKLPVIATKVGDNHKLIKSGKTGYLVDPENIQQLSLALSKLLDQPLQAKKMAAAGYQLVKNQYIWPKTTKKLIQAYQSIFK
jgi:glycosyltransferase involved in cell wall biosynthesis